MNISTNIRSRICIALAAVLPSCWVAVCAEAGARTLIVEYLHTLGGVGSDGMVLGYYCGNHVGFAKEFEQGEQAFGAETYVYNRVGTWRRMTRDAGVEVWYGALAEGAVIAGDRVAGVVVATPFGRGVVLAKSVVDATGNSDVAAAAGAETEFIGAGELAVQSAGQAPHLLGRGAGNTDFGLVNDSDAWDLWLFGLRSRAGAPTPGTSSSSLTAARDAG